MAITSLNTLSIKEIFKTLIEVELIDTYREDKNQIIGDLNELLSRMGITNRKDKQIYPSCYLLNFRKKFYITHFIELIALFGNHGTKANMTVEDYARRNTIVKHLETLDKVKILNPKLVTYIFPEKTGMYILNHKQLQEENWKIVHKFKFKPNYQEILEQKLSQ